MAKMIDVAGRITSTMTHEDSGIYLLIGLEKPRGVLSRDGECSNH